MRLTSFALLLCATNLLVGCDSGGNTKVIQSGDAEAIAEYEELVRKSEKASEDGLKAEQEAMKQVPDGQ